MNFNLEWISGRRSGESRNELSSRKLRDKIGDIERAYEEVIDFIAAGSTPGKVIAFRPSEASKESVAQLIHLKKTSGLSADENLELEHYLQLEHLMRLAKARAQRHVQSSA